MSDNIKMLDNIKLCEYCADKPIFFDDYYCSGYCSYRDTVVRPRKLAFLKSMMVQTKAEKKSTSTSTFENAKKY